MSLDKPLNLSFGTEVNFENASKANQNSSRLSVEKNEKKDSDIAKELSATQAEKTKALKSLEEKDKEHKQCLTKIKNLEESKEKLALENLRLITENSDLKKKNQFLEESVRRIELQMDLLKELLLKD